MAITAGQTTRLEAQAFTRDVRVKIGPPREFVTQGLFTAGSPVTLPAGASVQSHFDYWAGDRTLTVDSVTSDYFTTGTIVVTGALGTSWLEYSSRDTGANTFTISAVLLGPGEADPNDTVVQWKDITDPYVERVSWSESEEPPFRDYTIDLAGNSFNTDLFKNDATVLVEERVQAGGTDSGWMVAAIGYVPDWNARSDRNDRQRDRSRPWTATAYSIKYYVDRSRTNGKEYGRVDIARGKTVTDGWSETGQSPFNLGDLSLEPDEFAGGLNSTVSSNLVDGKLDTRYVSANAPTRTAETPGSYTGSTDPPATPRLIIDEIMWQGPTGAPADLQYIVIRLPTWGPKDTLDLDSDEHVLHVYDNTGALSWTMDLPEDVVFRETGDNDTEVLRLILFPNRETYESYFGTSGKAIGREWPSGKSLDTAGGAVHVRQRQYPPSVTTLEDFVAWGGWQANFFEGNDDEDHWDDTNVLSLPSAGHSMRRTPTQKDSDQASDWQEMATPMPADPPEDTDSVFISIDLGQFSVKLDGAITSGSPANGEDLSVDDATPLDPSGDIQIDSEQISYTHRDDTTLYNVTRGANSTTPASHSDEATIFQYDSVNGAHRMHAIESVQYIRQKILASDGLPVVPYNVDIWISTQTSPSYPGTAGYASDWVDSSRLKHDLNDGRATTWEVSLPLDPSDDRPFRARHLMSVFHEMRPAGDRLKLNEIRAFRWTPDAGTLDNIIGDSNQAPELPIGIAKVVVDLLQPTVDPSDISFRIREFLNSVSEHKVRAGELRGSLTDLLEKSLCMLHYHPDGTVELQRDPRHPLRNRPSTTATFDGDVIRAGHMRSYVSRLAIAQVVVNIENPNTLESYTGRYPPTVSNLGEVVEESFRLTVNSHEEASLVAQAIYLDHPKISSVYRGTTAGPAPWLHAGQAILGKNFSDAADDDGRLHIYRVTSVDHNNDNEVETFEAQQWRVVSTTEEADRDTLTLFDAPHFEAHHNSGYFVVV